MGYISNLLVKLGLDNSDFNTGMDKSTRLVDKFAKDVESAGARLTIGLSLPLIGVGAAALKAAGEMEQTNVAFTTLLKSADAAKSHIADLKQFALTTPFQFEDLTKASRLMQAFGTQASDVVPKLRILGNAVSALGGGNELLERVVRSMGEIGTRGKITGEQLRELSRAGIPALDALAAKMGITAAEAQAKVTAGLVDAKTATDGLMEYMNKRFAGGMEAQSKTLLGVWSNIKDKLTFTLVEIGNTLAPTAKALLNDFLDPALEKVRVLAEGFGKLSPFIQGATLSTLGLAAALPIATVALGATVTNAIAIVGAFSKLIPLLIGLPALVTPIGLALGVLAVGVGIASVELGHARQKFDEFAATFQKWLTNFVSNTKDFDAAHKKLEAGLASGAISIQQYEQALAILEEREKKAGADAWTERLKTSGIPTLKILAGSAMDAAKALETLNIKSSADRQKDLVTAKEAYEVLKKSGESQEVLAEAMKKVEAAQDAVYGQRKTLEVKEHFKALKNETSDFAILAEQYNQALARQKQLLSDIARDRTNSAKMAAEVANAGSGEMPTMGAFVDPKLLGDAENGMKGILVAASALPPHMKAINEAMAAFGLNAEKANVTDLAKQFGTLTQAFNDGELSQRSYDLALVKYIEDLDRAGVALTQQQIKEHDLAKSRTQQLQNSRKEESEYRREVQRTFQSLERGIASSIIHWKGLGSAVKSVFQGLGENILQIFLHGLLKPVENLFGKLVENLAAKLIGLFVTSKATASAVDVGEVAGAAAVGGAAAAASTAAIPIIGPALAPAAGAAMYAAILATYTPLAFFKQGGDVPEDMPAFLHAKEMVLPADIAVPLRRMVASNGTATPTGVGGLHIHIGNMTGVTRDTVDALGNMLIGRARRAGARI
jgi:tape measure domain-containing protein